MQKTPESQCLRPVDNIWPAVLCQVTVKESRCSFGEHLGVRNVDCKISKATHLESGLEEGDDFPDEGPLKHRLVSWTSWCAEL